jgi:hypothetical protein
VKTQFEKDYGAATSISSVIKKLPEMKKRQ